MSSQFIFETDSFTNGPAPDSFGPAPGRINRNSPEYVRWLQHALGRALKVQLPVDGVMGLRARKALRQFQRGESLLADGALGLRTEQRLIARSGTRPPVAPSGELELEGHRELPEGALNRHSLFEGEPFEFSPQFESEDEYGFDSDYESPAASGCPAFTLAAVENPGGGRIKDKTVPGSSDLVIVEGAYGRVPLHVKAAAAVEALVCAARADGIRNPLLLPAGSLSGFRSPKKQLERWQMALKKYGSPEKARKWVAKPGSSAHQSGRAIDFFLGGKNASGNVARLRATAAYKWMVANAKRFGFYPYENEPWHWEHNPPASTQPEIFSSEYDPRFEFEDEHGFESGAAGCGCRCQKRRGERGESEFDEQETFPQSILTLLRSGLQSAAVKLAITFGYRNETQLSNLVFNARHPERLGRAISKGEPLYAELVREWLSIRDLMVRPALSSSMPAAPAAGPSALITSGGSPDIVKVRGIRVARQIASKIEALLAAADADGIRLSGGGYRSHEAQIELRRQHCGTSHYAIYEKPSKECKPPTATPGNSHHEKGLAIDFTHNGRTIKSRSSLAFQWLAQNAERYGLYNLPSEPWHWSIDGR